MKTSYAFPFLLLIAGLISVSSFAQNTFPATGKVGIGISSPQTLFHINLKGDASTDNLNGIRIHFDKSNSVVRTDLGYETKSEGFVIHSWAGGAGYGFADINFKTNGVTRMFIESAGKIGIGTTSPTSLLTVNGTITAEEIIVQDVGADYVFGEQYNLRSLQELESYIKANKHLPGIAPASETEQGIKVGEFNEKLLEKIEELTLYMIELNKQVELLKQENQSLREQMSK